MTISRKTLARNVFTRYAVAACSTGAGWELRLLLRDEMHSAAPYITFIPAIVVSAWFGGTDAGIFSTFLSLLAVFYSVILPFARLQRPSLGDVVGALIFVIVGFFFSFEIARRVRAEAELEKAKSKAECDRDLLSTTLASIGDAVIAADAQGRITFLNAVAEGLTGWTQAESAGKYVAEVFVIQDETTRLPVESPAQRAMRDGTVIGLANHTVLVRKDGHATPIEDSAAPIRDQQGQVLGVVLVFRDVTQRRRAEQALQHSEERLKLALDAGQIGVWDWDVTRNQVDWSPLVYQIFGVAPGAFGGAIEDFAKLVHLEDRPLIGNELAAALQQNKPYAVEFRTVHPNGEVRWVAGTATVFRDERGEATRMLGSAADITARKQAEGELRKQWHTFDTALSHTPDFIYIFDLQGRFTYANRSLVALWRKPLEEAVGKSFTELGYPPELAERLQRQIQEVAAAKQPLRDETPFTGPSGETRHYEYIFVPVLDATGGVVAVAGSTRDVTERNKGEEALRKSEERLSFALHAGGGVGTWDWEIPEDLVYCSRPFAKLFSVDPERAAAGVPLREFVTQIHADDRQHVAQKIQLALTSGGDFAEEYRVLQPDGSTRWAYARGRAQLDGDGKPLRFPGVVFDITERKQAEEALLESQSRLRAIFDGTYEHIGLLSPDGLLLETNRASLTFAHHEREAAVGQKFWQAPWFSLTPGASEVLRDGVLRAAAGEFVRFEQTIQRPSGECVTFDISFHPVRNQQGEVVLIVPEGRDITERKRAEEEVSRSNEELWRVNRELEEFAYVASHDLQEPLRMVNIYTQIILKEIAHTSGGAESPKLAKYADFVRQGVTRMEALIRDLLTFSRAVHDDELPVATANLSDALNEALSVLKTQVEESGAQLTAATLPAVRGDTAQLAHVFQNLISNALKYRKAGVPPEITITCRSNGGHWVIAVEDNGIGFEQHYAERIFGLFKRLHKDEYPGTGLGLAICRRIVERYGGHICAEGRPGLGSTFYFSLPSVSVILPI